MKEADIRKYAALMKELELTGLEITEDNRVVRLERMIGGTARPSAPAAAPVRPGDTVETRCRIKRVKHPFYFAEGTVTVGERLCVSAEFSFAITEA